MIFDPSGNLFVASNVYTNGSVSEFAPEAVSPTTVYTGLYEPCAMVFNGSLFVSDDYGLTEFAAGDPDAICQFRNIASPLVCDSSGNFFAAGWNTVSEFDVSQSGSLVPVATLTGVDEPVAMAFDASGDLFVANSVSNTVSEFAPGATTPTATLSGLDDPTHWR